MSEPSKPLRPEEVRDGDPGGETSGDHETTTHTENATPAATPATPADPPPDTPEVSETSASHAEPEHTATTTVDPAEDVAAAEAVETTTVEDVLEGEDASGSDDAQDPDDAEGSDESDVSEEGSREEGSPEADTPTGDATPRKTAPKRPRQKKKPAKVPRPALNDAQRAEAREQARSRFLRMTAKLGDHAAVALDLVVSGQSLVYAGRFLRDRTGGMDTRTLRQLRDDWHDILQEEERRVELKEILRTHAALDEKTLHRLERANTIPVMEDVVAPHLPVVAGRATVARGLGLEPLAETIRQGNTGDVLSELAKAHVKEGEEPSNLDAALAGARDILAEEMVLDADLRARLRKAFRRDALVTVGLRAERKGDPGRHKSLVGFVVPAHKMPPLKFLAIRRGEKERVLVSTIEPPEESMLPLLHGSACADDHVHAGFLRAAIEDGYRRILKPIFQAEIRNELRLRADAAAVETFERNLRHRLLGPVGGPRPCLGLRPDVTGGHRWCAVDREGLPTGSGTLPHEGTAGREACLAELQEVLRTYEIEAVAVGSGAGRAAAVPLAEEAAKAVNPAIDVAVVSDGGTHTLEALGKLEIDDRPEVPAECRGALSLGRRFQDPLAELVTVDPKALALGPNLHDVHQGRLRLHLDDTVEQCVAHVGVDPNTASEDLLARVPGFNRAAARSFVTWRNAHGPLAHKAALAAVPGVGTEVAEQAVGFLRLPNAEDPRERVQLHPAQYVVVDRMAEQIGADVATLFSDASVRGKVRLSDLETKETPAPLLRYVLFQLAAGQQDERPRYTRPIPPPPGLTLDTLQPGLVLEGRVVRAMPFGLFVDVGLGTDALIPTPHIGAFPDIEPATIAPIGAVVQARVLEVLPDKRRLTLTMRPDRAMFDRGGPRGGARGGPRGGPRSGPQGDRRGGADARGAGQGSAGPRQGSAGPRQGSAGPRQGSAGPRQGSGGPRQGGGGTRQGGSGPQQGGSGPRQGQGGGGRPSGRPQRKAGKFGGGTGGIGDIFSGRRRDEPGAPRRISLSPDHGASPDEDAVDERNLTEEELLKRKLADLQKKFGGGEK